MHKKFYPVAQAGFFYFGKFVDKITAAEIKDGDTVELDFNGKAFTFAPKISLEK